MGSLGAYDDNFEHFGTLQVSFKGKLDANSVEAVAFAFSLYDEISQEDFIAPRRSLYDSLPLSDQRLLDGLETPYLDVLEKLNAAVQGNARLTTAIADHAEQLLKDLGEASFYYTKQYPPRVLVHSPADQAITRATVRQFYRDWSSEGAPEREAAHSPVLQTLKMEYGPRPDKQNIRILVPGAGLCRLPHTLATLGYSVEANEMSYLQLLASHFILSNTARQPKFQLSPWALSFSNHVHRSDQFQTVAVPDTSSQIQQSQIPCPTSQPVLTLNPGEFTTSYASEAYQSYFDVVATVFFLDTASNVLDYVRTIANCLRSGGLWINVGPLLWNCAENGPAGRREGDVDDDEAARSRLGQPYGREGVERHEKGCHKLELTHQDVLSLLAAMGFEVVKQDACAGRAGYVMDPKSMLQNIYQLAHWVARKI